MADDTGTNLRQHLRVVRHELLTVRAQLRDTERRVEIALEVIDKALGLKR